MLCAPACPLTRLVLDITEWLVVPVVSTRVEVPRVLLGVQHAHLVVVDAAGRGGRRVGSNEGCNGV
jgi:hypothetical protein